MYLSILLSLSLCRFIQTKGLVLLVGIFVFLLHISRGNAHEPLYPDNSDATVQLENDQDLQARPATETDHSQAEPAVQVISQQPLNASPVSPKKTDINKNASTSHSDWQAVGTPPPASGQRFRYDEFTGPVVKLVHGTNTPTGSQTIETEKNRLRLNSLGQLDILIDTSELDEAMRETGFLQLAMRYRRKCNTSEWHIPLTQESVYEQFADNVYKLHIDLCPKNAGKLVSVYIQDEKDLRPIASQVGSALSFILMAKAYASAVKVPNLDSGSYSELVASSLAIVPAMDGMDQVRQHLQSKTNIHPACINAGLFRAGMQFDRHFVANTEQLFATDSVRHFARSGAFNQWFECLRSLSEEHLFYPMQDIVPEDTVDEQRLKTAYLNSTTYEGAEQYLRDKNPYAANNRNIEAASSVFASLSSLTLLMQADGHLKEQMSNLEKERKSALERLDYGLELKGATTSLPYKNGETIERLYSQLQPAEGNSPFSIQENSTSFVSSYRTTLFNLLSDKRVQYGLLGTIYAGSTLLAHGVPINPAKLASGQQMLKAFQLLLFTLPEYLGFVAFNEVCNVVTEPLVEMLTNAAVEREWLTRDSTAHKAINAGLQLLIHNGLTWGGVELTRLASHQILTAATTPAAQISINMITASTVGGMVLPLVLKIDQNLFIPILNKGSAFFCEVSKLGVFCPGHEVSVGIHVLPGSFSNEGVTHQNQVVYRNTKTAKQPEDIEKPYARDEL